MVGLALWSAVEYYQTFAAVISGRTTAPVEPAAPAEAAPVVKLAPAATTSGALAASPRRS